MIISIKDKDYIISRYKQLLNPTDTLFVSKVKKEDFIQSSRGLEKFLNDIDMIDDEEFESDIEESFKHINCCH